MRDPDAYVVVTEVVRWHLARTQFTAAKVALVKLIFLRSTPAGCRLTSRRP